MMRLTAVLPKLAVFLVATLVGGSIAYVVVSALNRPQLQPTANEIEEPQFVMTADGQVAAFDLIDAAQAPITLAGFGPDGLGDASAALLDSSPPPGTTPLGYPRVPLVSQFDGGPFENANCTLASGAMLARLAYGIVTSGSVLRTLQFDMDGGTDLHDLNTATHRGYGADLFLGGVAVPKFRSILTEGGGAVIQGDYSKVPAELQLQKGATFPHAIYVDGFFAGDSDTPAAYYVIDPLGKGSYDGGWWPADILEEFAFGFSGSNRITAAWAFPPGGVPPAPINPDVPIIGGGAEASPPPGASPTPVPSGGIPGGAEAGDEPAADPPVPSGPPVLEPVEVADVDLVPILTVCLVTPKPAGCPDGVEAVFDKAPPILHVDLGPDIEVVGVDSNQPNIAFVAFRVEGSPPVDVTFWEADGSPGTISSASAIAALDIGGEPTFVARLDTLAGTDYLFQVVAGDGLFISSSPIGSFTTGDGVKVFDVALASVTDPEFELGTGFSPYLHLAADSFALPLLTLDDLPTDECGTVVDFGGIDYCELLDPVDDVECQSAVVTYELLGIDATGVLIQAYPTETGEVDGAPTLEGILEADGPAGSGEVSVGCLASGLDYTIALDVIGDDQGMLASRQVTVP